MKQTVVFDFDGVISKYENGWQGATIINDEPVDGIIEALNEISKKYRIVVLTSRCSQPGGFEAVRDWLNSYGIPYELITDVKPQALAYIDDRAICFKGNSKALLKEIESLEPWNMKSGELIEYVPQPGDMVEFEIFKGTEMYIGEVMYEFKMTNHINPNYNESIYYRIKSNFRSYDIPSSHIKKKVG